MSRFDFLVAIVFAPWACAGDHTCDVDAIAMDLAGTGAMNCGHVAINGDSTATDQCVANAFSIKGAFVARYDVQGIDSHVSRLVAGNASGNVYFLLWDSDPSGGSKAPETVDRNECISPSIDTATKRFTCESSGPTARVCGG